MENPWFAVYVIIYNKVSATNRSRVDVDFLSDWCAAAFRGRCFRAFLFPGFAAELARHWLHDPE